MSTAGGSAAAAGTDTILEDVIREAAEMVTKQGMKSAGVASVILSKLRSRFPLGSELALKFAGISAGKMVADAVAHSTAVPPVMKALIAPIIDDVIKGITSGMAEGAVASHDQKPVTSESPKGEMLVAVCRGLPGVHEFADGHLLCPMARAMKERWEIEHPPKKDQKKSQEKGKGGKPKIHIESVEKPGEPFPIEIIAYPLAKRTTADPFCPVCQISGKHEEALAKAEEKKPRKPMDRAIWSREIGREGRWLMIALAGSTGLKQSDFINEAVEVPPDLWRDLAYAVALRMTNRARKVVGAMLVRIGEPLPEGFYESADTTTLPPEDVEYCIKFLSGFGVTKLEAPTKIERVLDRIGENIPAESVKKGMKITLIGFGILGVAAVVAFIILLSQLTP